MMQILGKVVGVSHDQWRVLLLPKDSPLSAIPKLGIDLLSCLRHLPHMREFVYTHQLRHRTVRARARVVLNQPSHQAEFNLTVHPEPAELLQEFLENIQFAPADTNSVDVVELSSGALIKVVTDTRQGQSQFSVPQGCVWDTDEIRFWPTDQHLNEFGFFYVALFIVGNLARYYPDIWLPHIARSSPLVLAVEELLKGVEERMILLSLSEMQRTLLVVE